MNFSIIIPTLNNINYLKILIKSIKKNSRYNHEIVVHVNENLDGTINYLEKNQIRYTYSKKNIGLCSSVNNAAKISNNDYILYCHDDMYFLPEWDEILKKEIEYTKDNKFYLSGTMIQKSGADLILDCGDTYKNFNEDYLLNNYKDINNNDHQGSHWAPHLIHKDIWNKVGGFSEEFNPGDSSDSDLNMKLWNLGIRYFKGINNFKVYHFGSVSMRKKKEIKKNNGALTFIKKWKISQKFFFKHYLRSGENFDGYLKEPNKNFQYYLDFLRSKINYLYSFLR